VAVSDAIATFKVEAVFTDMLEPYPAEITQNEVRACPLNCVILSHARVTAYPETQLFPDSVQSKTLFLFKSREVVTLCSIKNNLEALFRISLYFYFLNVQ
jgi:hypothetical protein